MKKRRNRVSVRNPDSTPENANARTSLTLRQDKSAATSVTKSTAVERAPLLVKENYTGPVVPRSMLIAAAVISAAILIWSYWPTWVSLVTLWEREPDYSHGWFVIPIAAYLLWSFKDSMPPVRSTLSWGGLVMLGCVALVRVFARFAYFDFLDGWTIPLTAIGLAWVFGGRQWAYWALPALGFLFFMIPLPFRIENELSQPLQWIATNASCYTLQLLGQPAIAEGTTILLGDQILEVERACSGLRIFMGVFALAYVYAVLVRRSWWERVLLVLAAVPIALVSNAARIIATGLCFQWFSGETARHFSHDLAGYVMIVFAAGLFGLTLLYLRWLVQDAQTMDQASLQRV
ncbi:MAG: exosortase/archaeosortase family protein [Planctomycetes bacterium]|nr:exosortase/archaeosortase family protein [Planctomycetota bacterium]